MNVKFLHILYVFVCFSPILSIDQNDWIDPFDMSSGQSDIILNHRHTSSKTIEIHDCKPDESRSMSYLKRTINLLLNAARQDRYDEHIFRGHIVFEIDSFKYRTLKDFTEGKVEDLNEVDMVLSEVLRKPSYDYLEEYFLPLCHRVVNFVTSRTGIFFVSGMSYAFVLWQMMKGHFSYFSIIKFLLINVLFIDFAFVWIRLYQKAEIDKLAGEVKFQNAPPYCDPNKMTTFELLWKALSTKDTCKEYFHVTLTDIFWNVSPGDVIIEMCTRLITQPIKTVGPAIGDMILTIYGNLPMGTGLVLLPLIVAFIMTMTCILLSFCLNISIRFNFFHLISFSFGDREGNDRNVGRIVERLIDTVRDISVPRLEDNRSNMILNRQESRRAEMLPINREEISNNFRSITEDDKGRKKKTLGIPPGDENDSNVFNISKRGETKENENNENGNETNQNGNKSNRTRLDRDVFESNRIDSERYNESGSNRNDNEIKSETMKSNSVSKQDESSNFLERLTEVLNESILNVTEGGDTTNNSIDGIRKRKQDDGSGDV